MKIELFEEDIPEFSNEMMTLTQVFAAFKCGEDLQMARYNLKNQSEIFQNYPQVAQMLGKKDVLPLTLVDGEITLIGDYPTVEDLTEITGLSFQNLGCEEDCQDCSCQ